MTSSERPAGIRPIGAPGHMGVDYEERVDFARLREYRVARASAALAASECGAFLLFDFYNIRYTTQTWIGGALGDKMIRYALLFRDRDPILWDFGSAVRHHQVYSTWLPQENWRPGFLHSASTSSSPRSCSSWADRRIGAGRRPSWGRPLRSAAPGGRPRGPDLPA